MALQRLLMPLLAGLAIALLTGCPDKKPKYPNCASEKDCKDGQKCVNKKCVECAKNADCGEGQECKKGSCIAAGDACETEADCADGEVCKNGTCQACESNGECGPGGKCNEGSCERPKACKVDEDCEDDEDCIDGRCQRPWQGDAPDNLSCELKTIPFQFNEAAIPDAARDLLNEVAECIQQAPEDRGVYIVGHADESGTEEYNIALSERRARAVADYLARLGIDPARFRIVPKGEAEPTGQSPEADRRVEFEWR